jgi:hypothetical protein
VSNDAYSRAGRQTSGWAVGFILFAAIMMLMVGHLPGVAGAHRHLRERVLCGHPQLPVPVGRHHLGLDPPDPRAAGGLRRLGLLSGRTWARAAAIALAVLSAIANFLFIPYYPFWSLVIITLDIFVIWAIAAHGGDLGEPV